MRMLMMTVPLFVMLGCQSPDPGLQVERLADPLRSETAAAAATREIIPVDQVRKSQLAALSQRIANTDVTVTYSRPVARGRELFGALVPYDEVWNPGADQATAIAFTRDVEIEGQPLAAGRYSVWAIPRDETWTVIFNRAADVFHTPYPGEAQDALRIEVRPEPGQHMEALSFYFPVVEGKDAVLRLHWGEVMIPMSIRVP
jgi:hypothetical protein